MRATWRSLASLGATNGSWIAIDASLQLGAAVQSGDERTLQVDLVEREAAVGRDEQQLGLVPQIQRCSGRVTECWRSNACK